MVREYRGVTRVNANRGELVQLVVNLLINAAQATPRGHPDRHGSASRRARKARARWCSPSATRGQGSHRRSSLGSSNPFFSTRSIGEGLGLGLSISHNIVTLLGGEISVESRLGEGTTITILLPAAADAPPD